MNDISIFPTATDEGNGRGETKLISYFVLPLPPPVAVGYQICRSPTLPDATGTQKQPCFQELGPTDQHAGTQRSLSHAHAGRTAHRSGSLSRRAADSHAAGQAGTTKQESTVTAY